MRYECNAVLLGTENRVSGKGNSYSVVLFGQGAQVQNMMLSLDKPVGDLKLYQPYKFVVDYDIRWKQFKCVDIQVVDDKK